MRFTFLTLVTVDVTDLNALVIAAAESASTGVGPPTGQGLAVTGPATVIAASALTELAYPPAVIDGYPGIDISSWTLGAPLLHPVR